MKSVAITLTPEQVDAIASQLGSDGAAIDFFNRDEAMIRPILPGRSSDFPIWKTIKLGICRNAEDYHTALVAAGCIITDTADAALDDVHVSEEVEVDLVVVAVDELGFDDETNYIQICHRAAASRL